jgi:hypothetical protein
MNGVQHSVGVAAQICRDVERLLATSAAQDDLAATQDKSV